MDKKIVLVLIFILGGCSKPNFVPTNSTCNQVERDLVNMQLIENTDNLPRYSSGDLYRYRQIANSCRRQISLSEKDYEKYMQLLNQIEKLNKDADSIIKRGEEIHSQRIKSYE